MDEYKPIHQEVWDKLDSQAEELFRLQKQLLGARKKIKDQKLELKKARKENERLRSRIEPKQHYRNGRKRGRSFNG